MVHCRWATRLYVLDGETPDEARAVYAAVAAGLDAWLARQTAPRVGSVDWANLASEEDRA
jgi:hypothetical protein